MDPKVPLPSIFSPAMLSRPVALRSFLPSPGMFSQTRGHDIRTTSTRAPFSEVWVKIENWRTPQDVPSGGIITNSSLIVKAILRQLSANLLGVKIAQLPGGFGVWRFALVSGRSRTPSPPAMMIACTSNLIAPSYFFLSLFCEERGDLIPDCSCKRSVKPPKILLPFYEKSDIT